MDCQDPNNPGCQNPSASTTPQQTCPDGSQPDSNGNCPNSQQQAPSLQVGCGPGTDNSTCPTTPISPPPTVGCGPGTDNSTCGTTTPCSCTASSCTIGAAYVVDASKSDPPCIPTAVANANPSVVNGADTVTLDGSQSTDSGGGPQLLYQWQQTGGPTVDISDYTVVTPTFTAPKDLSDTTKLTFSLVVTDNLDVNNKAYHGNPSSTPSTVDVTVCAPKKDPLLRSGALVR